MQLLMAIVLVVVLGGGYVLKFGFYPRFFDLEWDEDVMLHDGRVATVHVKLTFERRDRFSRYENTTFRLNELTFDAGNALGRTTLRSRLGVRHLDQVAGTWYAVFYGQGPFGYPEERPDYWGDDFTVSQERLAKLENGRFVPIAWELAPPGAILRSNRIVSSASVEVLASFNKRRMTLSDKERLRAGYLPGPGGGEISRPIRMRQLKGEKA